MRTAPATRKSKKTRDVCSATLRQDRGRIFILDEEEEDGEDDQDNRKEEKRKGDGQGVIHFLRSSNCLDRTFEFGGFRREDQSLAWSLKIRNLEHEITRDGTFLVYEELRWFELPGP
ncbi:hypothetical protein V1477_006531 [Vespula maculifrons]|uniref:Uncharacterized protein n=1 Tax=Vespula maculifrons TaxID=7453 RepID=A0ABD2CJU4_VESMC